MTQPHSFLNILPKDFPNPVIALLGGGGKSSLMFQLGMDFAHQNKHVLLTSITKAGPSEIIPMTLINNKGNFSLSPLFKYHNPVYLLKEQLEDNKYKGISKDQLASFIPEADITLFECDGSRNLPLKAHRNQDPAVPDFATHTIVVIGADVIHTKLSEGKVHRPGLFKSLWGVQDNTPMDIPLITRVLTDKRGYISKIPSGMNKIYFINKSDIFPKECKALATFLASMTPDPVFFGSIRETWWEKA